MKKKITAIALAVSILVVGVIGATMAYFTDKDTSTNTFTMGKVDITLTETSTADEANGILAGEPKNDGGYEYTTVLPGLVYSKKPTVTVEDGSVDAWVIVTATVPTVYDFDGLLTQTSDGYMLEKKTVGDKTTYYFYYNGVKAAGAAVTPFTQVTINPALTQEIAGEAFDIVVNAYAIQAEGFTSAQAAFAACFAVADADTLSTTLTNAKNGDTIVLAEDVALTARLSVNKNVTIDGNGTATISKMPVYLGAENVVTFKGVNFDDTTGDEKTSSVYGEGFKGTVVFDGCTFGDNNWESIQITPAGDCTIIIKNCTFTAKNPMKRFIHIEPAAVNTFKLNVTVTGCTFNGCDKVNYSTSGINRGTVADFDYFAKGSTLTLGGNTFVNSNGNTATALNPYFCMSPYAAATEQYGADLLSKLTGTVTTYTVTDSGLN